MALVMVLVAVTVLSLATLVPLRNERQAMQRERERELLFIGRQFRDAIASYAAVTPQGSPQFPKTLSDLLEDKRFPTPRRHLRRIYLDPMTGLADWTLLKEQGGIVGVASSSTRVPLMHSGFAAGDQQFAEATSYADWKFTPQSSASSTAVPAAQAPAPPTAAPPTADPPPALQPPAPVPHPSTDRRTECLHAYSAALNLCARDASTPTECRMQARASYLACLGD